MTDIHNHSLFGVDDGARTPEESIKMLQAAKEQGIDAVILTPHYRHGMFFYPQDKVHEHFEMLRERADEIGIKLYLGCEFHVNSRILDSFRQGRCETLAGSDYVLLEFDYETEYTYILHHTKQMLFNGYIPVIAHAERYQCLLSAPERCMELKQMGVLIQINADSVLGKEGFKAKLFCRKLLKNGGVHFIASDAHGIKERQNHLGESYFYIKRKYGREYAEHIFCKNPEKIISNIERRM